MKKMFVIAALAFFPLASFSAVIDFHIAAGTGGAAWDKPDNPVTAKVGDTIRIHNDDSVVHFLHTDGAPCPHGTNPFNPGETYDCVTSVPYNEADMTVYDHNYGPDAQFYLQVNP